MEILFIITMLAILFMLNRAIKQEKRNRGSRYFNGMIENIQQCAEDREMMDKNFTKKKQTP